MPILDVMTVLKMHLLGIIMPENIKQIGYKNGVYYIWLKDGTTIELKANKKLDKAFQFGDWSAIQKEINNAGKNT